MSTSRPDNNLDPDPDRSRQGGIEVEISDTQGFLDSRSRPGSPGWSRGVLATRGSSTPAISVALVDDATIHRINRQHLGHDWPTDVISFPLSEPGEPELAGELVVSAEMAPRPRPK